MRARVPTHVPARRPARRQWIAGGQGQFLRLEMHYEFMTLACKLEAPKYEMPDCSLDRLNGFNQVDEQQTPSDNGQKKCVDPAQEKGEAQYEALMAQNYLNASCPRSAVCLPLSLDSFL